MSHPQPLGGNEMPRFGGLTTFMRLPGTTAPAELDVAVVGVPLDIGTSNRPGARFGPRAIRSQVYESGTYHLDLGIEIFGDLTASGLRPLGELTDGARKRPLRRRFVAPLERAAAQGRRGAAPP